MNGIYNGFVLTPELAAVGTAMILLMLIAIGGLVLYGRPRPTLE